MAAHLTIIRSYFILKNYIFILRKVQVDRVFLNFTFNNI